jgi:predicted HicB family RNase H-like nuclease
MSQLLEYRGFQGTVLYSTEDKLLHGRVVGVRGLVSYEGENIPDLEADFRIAVDDYIAFLDGNSVTPLPPTEVVPVPFPSALHERAVRFAEQHNQELTDVFEEAVSKFLDQAA